MLFRNKTHTNRWSLAESYNDNWKQRAIQLMDLFTQHEFFEGSTNQVVEYGCGAFAPFHTLFNGKNGFEVAKYDIKAWDEQTSVMDLNGANISLPTTNISVFSGVLEYLNDVPAILRKAIEVSDYVLISYAFLPADVCLSDNKFLKSINIRAVTHGWRNHYTNKELVELVSAIGVISATDVWGKSQSLFLLRNPKLDRI